MENTSQLRTTFSRSPLRSLTFTAVQCVSVACFIYGIFLALHYYKQLGSLLIITLILPPLILILGVVWPMVGLIHRSIRDMFLSWPDEEEKRESAVLEMLSFMDNAIKTILFTIYLLIFVNFYVFSRLVSDGRLIQHVR